MQAIDQSAADRRPDPQGAYFDGALLGGDHGPGGGRRDHRGLRGPSRGAGAGLARRGHGLDRADHGRDRDREGARRPRHPRGVATGQARPGQGQLRRAAGGARRLGTVRPREGSFHGRAGEAAGPVRAGGRRHDLPRRGRRAAAAGPGRPPPRAAGARVRARRWHETLRTDARVVAATNRNLEEAVREGKFRTDLFFRLNVFPIRVPALRERAEDIPLLAEYWASRYSRTVGKGYGGSTNWPWPRSAPIRGPGTSGSCRTSWSAR